MKQRLYELYARMQMKGLVTQRFACSDAAAKFLFRGKGEYTVVPNAIAVKKYILYLLAAFFGVCVVLNIFWRKFFVKFCLKDNYYQNLFSSLLYS